MRNKRTLFLAFACTAIAAGQTIVTTCGRDDSPGGVNLSSALATGGSIVIRCGPGAQAVQITQTFSLSGAVSLVGEGQVTLSGDGSKLLFQTTGALTLSNLTIRNASPGSSAAAAGIAKGESIALDKVRTENSRASYTAASFRASDSIFASNGDANSESSAPLIDAEHIELYRVTFDKNSDFLIGGGQPPSPTRAPLSRSIRIEDSTFTANVSPILALDAKLLIRRSNFQGNGVAPESSAGSWTCCGGAVQMVYSDAQIEDTTFSGNNSAGFGGALNAISSRVTLARCLFEKNTARAGGAVMFWGHAALTNYWSSGNFPFPLTLTLDRPRFHANRATELGGAIFWSGQLLGSSALFSGNQAKTGGAIAHESAAPLPAVYSEVLTALGGATVPGVEALALSRGVFIENNASQGSALDAGAAPARFGNLLAARNSGPGAALYGTSITLVNSTVSSNAAIGAAVRSGGKLTLISSIVADNKSANCQAAQVSVQFANYQYPGNSCGSAIARTPDLDSRFAPGLLSPARNAGNPSTCLSDPFVAGVDVYGNARANSGACSAGAVEPDPRRDWVGGTIFDQPGNKPFMWMFWLIIFFLVLGLLFARFLLRRRRRRHHDNDGGGDTQTGIGSPSYAAALKALDSTPSRLHGTRVVRNNRDLQQSPVGYPASDSRESGGLGKAAVKSHHSGDVIMHFTSVPCQEPTRLSRRPRAASRRATRPPQTASTQEDQES